MLHATSPKITAWLVQNDPLVEGATSFITLSVRVLTTVLDGIISYTYLGISNNNFKRLNFIC